ncbi:MAG: FAD-binding oxidoreductase [bacterium]
MISQTISGKIQSIIKLNNYIYGVNLKINGPFLFKAGQFISYFINDKQARAYSIASSPRLAIDKNELNLIVGPHPGGDSEKYYQNAKVGDECQFRGPFGIFTMEKTLPIYNSNEFNSERSIVYIATSTGIAPFLSMIEYLADIGYKNKIVLYFGVRYQEDIFLLDVFEDLKKRLNFTYYICISKPSNDLQESENIKFGYVTENVIKYQNNEDYCYICGSTVNVQSISTKLNESNFKNVYFENYG